MNGVLNIYKDKGCSSFHIVYEIRKLTGEQKVGHTGTLDPDVTGVLPICIGKATKLVGQLTDTDKTYHCIMRLGISTDTQDMSGAVISRIDEELLRNTICMAANDSSAESAKAYIEQIIFSFEGESEQIPPMYSALKVNGMKLVNAARKGIEVERKARKIQIYSMEDICVSDDLLHAEFTVSCSKGTYIRTLCEDIGKKLGIPACMERLERTRSSGLGLDTAITLEQAKEFASEGKLEEHIIGADEFLQIYPALTVQEEAVRRLLYGNYLYEKDLMLPDSTESTDCRIGAENEIASFDKQPAATITDTDQDFLTEAVPCSIYELKDTQIYRIYDQSDKFYALYQYDRKDKCLKCVKMFTDLPDR